MKKIMTFILLFAMVTINAQEKSKSKKVNLEVSGVCGMCKSRIEKAAFKTKGVKSAEWSIETKKLTLIINEFKTDILTVQKNIASIGHDTKDVQASDEAYNSLHGCCKYERTFVRNKGDQGLKDNELEEELSEK
jgi:cation transport ATPase